jgi:glycine/D-amino acid oxidase-like deaminating enzyme
MSAPSFDVAIVGGGLVGASLAFGLRSIGAKLLVLDDGGTASPSRANFGLVWVQGKGERFAPYAHWTVESARAWPKLADELRRETGIDAALVQNGGVHACLSSLELDARARYFDRLFGQPGAARYEVALLDRDALSHRLPGLGAEVAGGSFCPLDGHCNPLRLLRGLHAAMAKAGVVHRQGDRVIAVEPLATRFRIVTASGSIDAERVVLAAGLGNARLARGIGVEVPVRPNKGQVLVLERVQPLLPLALDTIRQTDEGTILVGDSQEERGDDATSLPVLGAMARRAIATFPALARLNVLRGWAALRVMTPDGAPIYHASDAHPGAFVVNAHSGVTLAAAHAYRLAPAIAEGTLPGPLAPYRATRFDDVRAVA